jgi:hypothetical protein
MDVVSSAAELERVRVARHVGRGSRAARGRDVSHLDRELQLVRRLLLDELDRYVGAGSFLSITTSRTCIPTSWTPTVPAARWPT